MVIYSIKDIEHLAGVKAHTIRIWEKRYSIVEPKRTETNIRFYTEDDLQHILNIALLNNNGIKISQIAKMPREDIQKRVAQISDFDDVLEDSIDCLTMSMMELNEYNFDKIIEANIQQLGFQRAMMEVIFPILDKLGGLWMSGCIKPTHELFVSQIIKRKIIKAIDGLPVNTDNDVPKFLIFLSEQENSDLSLLYLHYMLKNEGLRVIDLGSNVEKTMILESCNLVKPDYMVLLINESFADQPLVPFLNTLCKNIGETTVLLSGFQAVKQEIKSTRKVKVLAGLEDILSFCNKIAH